MDTKWKHAALSLSLRLMATHIVSWGGNNDVSITSIDYIRLHKRTTTSAFQGRGGEVVAGCQAAGEVGA
jgi:hypothetical protein